MHKTASQIASTVLYKLAIDMATAREATRRLLRGGNLVRGRSVIDEGAVREYKQLPKILKFFEGPTSGYGVPVGKGKGPLKVFVGGDVSGPMSREYGGKLSKLEKEMTNRLSILHETAERRLASGRGMSKQKHLANWPEGLDPTHVSPDILLQESNMLATLPKEGYGNLRKLWTAMRGDQDAEALKAIRKLYPDFQYGATRLSRGARKRITEGMRQ
jgi:hypothetical protein